MTEGSQLHLQAVMLSLMRPWPWTQLLSEEFRWHVNRWHWFVRYDPKQNIKPTEAFVYVRIPDL